MSEFNDSIEGEPARIEGELRVGFQPHGLEQRTVDGDLSLLALNGEPYTMIWQMHSWSSFYDQALTTPVYGTLQNCAWICPNFYGQNNQPNGAWSDNLRDLFDSYFQKYNRIFRPRRHIVFGGSGGGMMTWNAIGTWPGRFAGCSSWVGIHDFRDWWNNSPNFRPSLEQCFLGTPAQVGSEYDRRSAKAVLPNARDCIAYVNGAQLDDQVPIYHSADAAAQLDGLPGVTLYYDPGPNRGHIIDDAVCAQQISAIIAST